MVQLSVMPALTIMCSPITFTWASMMQAVTTMVPGLDKSHGCHVKIHMVINHSYKVLRQPKYISTIVALEHYCENPPPAPILDGYEGTTTWDETLNATTPFDFVVTYTCGIARKFQPPDLSLQHYETATTKCLWDRTWDPPTVTSY